MDRSTIHYLKQKGWTNTQIAQLTGHHRDTVAQVLREPLDKAPAPRDRPSAVSVYEDLIRVWVEEDMPVTRMLELARSDPKQPVVCKNTSVLEATVNCSELSAEIPIIGPDLAPGM